jgi:hypothetical protein
MGPGARPGRQRRVRPPPSPLTQLSSWRKPGDSDDDAQPPITIFNCQTASDIPSHCRGASRPGCAIGVALDRKGGRREGRVFATPMARLQKESRRQSPQVWPQHPAFPARWFTSLYRALLGAPGFLATVAHDAFASARIPASGYQDHTTSPSAPTTVVHRRRRVHRIPRSTSVTTRTPLRSRQDGMREHQILEKRKRNIWM